MSIIYPKATDSICNQARGWIAIGKFYTIIGSTQIGTNISVSRWGWIDIVTALDFERQSNWSYMGVNLHDFKYFSPTFEASGKVVVAPYDIRGQYQYSFIDFLFCKCGAREIDCTDCCASCCSVASEFLKKIKG